MGSLRRAFTETAFTGDQPRIIGVAREEIRQIELRGAVDLALEAMRADLRPAAD